MEVNTEDSLFFSPAELDGSTKRRIARNGTSESRSNTIDAARKTHSTQLSNIKNSGATCTRANKLSNRNRVIMKSIDATTESSQGGFETAMNSTFGGQFRPRLALNNHTTIEMHDHMNTTTKT